MRAGAVWAVFLKDLRGSFRSKHVLFWSVVFPLMLLTLLVVVFAPRPQAPPPAKVVRVHVVTDYANETLLELAEELVKYMNMAESEGARLFNASLGETSLSEEIELLRRGELDAVVYIDSDMYDEFVRNLTLRARVYVLRGTPDPTGESLSMLSLAWFFNTSASYAAVGAARYAAAQLDTTLRRAPLNPSLYDRLEEALRLAAQLRAAASSGELDPETRALLRSSAGVVEELGAALRSSPLNPNITASLGLLTLSLDRYGNNTEIEWVEVRPRGVEEVRPYVIGWMTLSVIFMEFMFNGVLGAAVAVAGEFDRGYMRRLLSTSVRPLEMYLGKMLSVLVLNAVTSTLILLWGVFAMGAKFAHGLLAPETASVLAIMLDATLFSMSLGVLIGLLVRSAEAANLAANAVIWPTMILGGFWFPKFMMPPEIRWFADVNPFSNLMYAVVEVTATAGP